MTNPQPYLAGLHDAPEIHLARFARLYMPPNAPDTLRLLWLMASSRWEPTPENAVLAGFLNLRDTVRHLADDGVQIESEVVTRESPYSGKTRTVRYRLVPSPASLTRAYGLLIAGGFVEHPQRLRTVPVPTPEVPR